MNSRWLLQSALSPGSINQSQQEVHRAAQALAWMSNSVLEPAADDSHTNLGYWSEHKAFITYPLADFGFLAFHLPSFSLVALDPQREEIDRRSLANLNKKEVLDQLQQLAQVFGYAAPSIQMIGHYDLSPKWEDTEVLAMPSADHLEQMHRYRANVMALIDELKQDWIETDHTCTWPHHFDIASLDVLVKNEAGENQQTIGFGLAIADSLMDEPYYYVSYWDRAGTKPMSSPAPLSHGRWIMDGFKGSVLAISTINNVQNAEEQQALLRTFFQESHQACLRHLQAS